MAIINTRNKQIQLKLVYYGPGRSGKTTNLEWLANNFEDRVRTKLVAIKTSEDRTLFFDFFPLNVGKINGFDVLIQLYTVPGQVKYSKTRELVLRGVDGIVFVADSLPACREKNSNSLADLKRNLRAHKKSIEDVPLVLQYNKRDLSQQGVPLLSVGMLEKDLNAELKAPAFPASGLDGENVLNTLKKIIALTMLSVESHLSIDQSRSMASTH